MLAFGTGASTAASAVTAARDAARQAREAAGAPAKLVIAFTSVDYADLDGVHDALVAELGPVPVIGGTSGGSQFATAIGERGPAVSCSPRGVTVVVLGGPDLEVAVESASIEGGLIEVVAAAERVRGFAERAQSGGFPHATYLVFAPGAGLDGDAFVAAVRKGAGERAALAGGLSGDDLALRQPKVFGGGRLSPNHAVIAGLFTRNPVGIAARHGWRPIGPIRTITRIEGTDLHELDGRPAIDVWIEDARKAGMSLPEKGAELGLYVAQHHSIGIVPEGGPRSKRRSLDALDDGRELIVRTPYGVLPDGGVRMTAAIGEGTRVRLLHARREDLLDAADDAATSARAAAGKGVAGAIVLSCTGRLLALGERFCEESRAIATRVAAPIAGACVYGEIARNIRAVDAFFNTTAVVIAFGR